MPKGDDVYQPKCIDCRGWDICFPQPRDKVHNADRYPCPEFKWITRLNNVNMELEAKRVRELCQCLCDQDVPL